VLVGNGVGVIVGVLVGVGVGVAVGQIEHIPEIETTFDPNVIEICLVYPPYAI